MTMKRNGTKSTRYYSSRQEKKVAKAVGGRQTANSGATAFSKGDVVTDLFLIECKTATTEKQSMSIKKEWLRKNEEEAFAMGKQYSALAFDFGDGLNYYIIDGSLFRYLVQKLKEEENEN